MTKRSLLIAATVAAVMSFGSAAQAAFSVVGTITGAANTNPAAGLTFSANSLTVTSTPNPTVAVSYNVANIVYSGASNINTTFSVTESFSVNNTGFGNASFTATYSFAYQVDANGNGNLTLTGVTGFPTTVAGVTFTGINLAAPTITPLQTGQTTGGSLSTTAIAVNGAIPEPASLAMVGLGLAGVGGLALRRRSK